MGNLSEIIQKLTPAQQREAEQFVTYLIERDALERERIRLAIRRGDADFNAGRFLDDDRVKTELEREFGPLKE